MENVDVAERLGVGCWPVAGGCLRHTVSFSSIKACIQYAAYTQFNSGNKNYDGVSRSASDNNTIHLFAWVAF